MNAIESRRYEKLTRVREFGLVHKDLFPASDVIGELFATVGKTVEELDEHATTQAAGQAAAREGAITKATARDVLRTQLTAIGRTARALAPGMPGIDNKFRMPRAPNEQALLAVARAFARDAAPLAADFAAHGLPKTFVAALTAGIEAFDEAIRTHETGRDVHVAARASIKEALGAGLAAVRRVDAIVPNYLGDDAVVRAMWARARRLENPRREKRPEAESATPPPAGGVTQAA